MLPCLPQRVESHYTPATVPTSAKAVVAPVAVWVSGEINDENLVAPSRALRKSAEEITLWIDSPGGSVDSGFTFIDTMRAAQRRGVRITCVVDGMAASMAGVILEACDVRLMTRQSSLLFHTVSIGYTPGGNQWDVERLAEKLKELNKLLSIFVVGRLNISLECYEAHVKDKDWWLGYAEALEVGAVDGVY